MLNFVEIFYFNFEYILFKDTSKNQVYYIII